MLNRDPSHDTVLAAGCGLFDCPCPPPPTHTYLEFSFKNAPCTVLHLLLLVPIASATTAAGASHRDTCAVVPRSLPCFKAFLFQRLADPGAVTLGAEGLEELLLRELERQGCHLGLGVGGQREEVAAATPLAQSAKQSEQVGLGHSGHTHFVARGEGIHKRAL